MKKAKNKWNNYFKEILYFLHGTTDFFGIVIRHSGATSFILEERKTDKNSRILLLDVTIDTKILYWLIYIMLTNEKDQLNTIDELSETLKNVNIISTEQIILGVGFNLYFDSLLESQGGNPVFKKNHC